MVCKACVEKYQKYYEKKGFEPKVAYAMALKLVKRVEKRRRKQKVKESYKFYKYLLFRWVFLTNWKATFFWSFRLLRVNWVGRSFNPDYTQSCTGSCASMNCSSYGTPCGTGPDCYEPGSPPTCNMGSCTCPAALPNSAMTSNNCTCNATPPKCTQCSVMTSLCTTKTYVCVCGNTCSYTCDPGYTWDGAQCVGAAGVVLRRLKVFVGL